MTRLAILGLALTAAVAASAAAPNTGTIVFVNSSGLHAVGADGTGLSLLRRGDCPADTPPPCPDAKTASWSPDGARLAAVFGTQLYVFDSRDGSQRLLRTGVEVSGASPPAWAPDGQRLAFLDLEVVDGYGTLSDLYVLNIEMGTVRRLTNGREISDPSWAPAQEIVFSSAADHRSELVVVDPDKGAQRQLTSSERGVVNRRPSWSPTGTEIAFVNLPREGLGRLQVIRADGGGLRTLSALPVDVAFGHRPVWSPDGSRIAFSTWINGRPSPVSQIVIGRDLYVVGANGAGERRLTESAERGFTDRDPTWSPDGSQLAFESYDRDARSKSSIYAVNADGTCERPLATVPGWQPEWQPTVGTAPTLRDCIDLSVVAKSPRAAGIAGRLLVTVMNDGTQPLSRVQLASASTAATVLAATSPVGSCSAERGALGCRLGALGPGETVDVAVQAESRVISQAGGLVLGGRVTLSVLVAGEQEEVLSNNRVALELSTTRCTTNTAGAGILRGSVFDDTICGRRGYDVIDGNAGRDAVRAGAGNDLIDARDGEPDDISCGSGADRVLADRADVVAPDCERVRRNRRS
ncbi:MAG: hypothetical protein ABR583_14685 [Gaiellaceae bacterium]